MKLEELTQPFHKSQGYIPPMRQDYYAIRDAFIERFGDKTPLEIYCHTVVNDPSNKLLTTACLILGA